MVFALGMKNSKHDNPIIFDQVKEFVRKPRQENAPKASVVDGKSVCIDFQGFNDTAYLVKKPVAKAVLTFLIPEVRLSNIFVSPRSYNNRPIHD